MNMTSITQYAASIFELIEPLGQQFQELPTETKVATVAAAAIGTIALCVCTRSEKIVASTPSGELGDSASPFSRSPKDKDDALACRTSDLSSVKVKLDFGDESEDEARAPLT